MGPDQVTELMRMLLKEALIISAPVLLLATVISVIVSLTLTLISLQDQTLSQVPRLAIVGIALLVGLPMGSAGMRSVSTTARNTN